MLADVLAWWVERCERWPRAVLATLAALTLLIGVYVVGHFAIDSDLSRLVKPSGQLAWYEANESFKAIFPESQLTSVVVVSGTRPEAVDASARRLADAFRASDAMEFVFAPALDPTLRERRAYYLPLDTLEDWVSGVEYDYGAMLRLADSADLVSAAFTLADQVAATDGLRLPTLLGSLADDFEANGVPEQLTLAAYPHLVPPAGEPYYVVIIVKGRPRLDESLPNAAHVRELRSLMASVAAERGVAVRLTGEVPLSHDEMTTALDGIGIAGTLSLLLLAIVLRLGVRSWEVIAATFVLLGVGVVWTLGFAAFVVGPLNTLALIFVVMFFGLGVDFAVHFSLRLWESSVPTADEDPEVHAVREIGPALGLCMLTSSIAFLSFAPTDYRGLAELGVISAGGMVIAYALTLTLLPAFFEVFGLPPQLPVRGELLARLHRVRPAWVLSITAVLALGAFWLARDLRFDYSVLAMRDADSEAMSTLLELQEQKVATDYSINVLVADADAAVSLRGALEIVPEVGDVILPQDLVPEEQPAKHQQLRELAELLSTIGPVLAPEEPTDATGLADAVDYLREVRRDVRQDDLARYDAFTDGLERLESEPLRLAALNDDLNRGLAAELGDLRELTAAEPFGIRELPADLRARVISPDGRYLVTVLPAGAVADRDAVEAFVTAVQSVTPDVTGRAVVEWGVGNVVVRSFVEALSLAIVAIALLLVIYFRSLPLALIVLVPLGLTCLATFAIMEISHLTLNMANILVFPLIFGLGVDTGIHVAHRYTRVGNLRGLLESSTTRAVLISGLTTIGTFFSLSFSPHKGAASVGLLLTIAIGLMLVVTFLVLPALLEVLGRSRWGSESGGDR